MSLRDVFEKATKRINAEWAALARGAKTHPEPCVCKHPSGSLRVVALGALEVGWWEDAKGRHNHFSNTTPDPRIIPEEMRAKVARAEVKLRRMQKAWKKLLEQAHSVGRPVDISKALEFQNERDGSTA